MPEQQHVCPYAAALSDDEDASHHSSGVPSGSANSPKGIAEEALAAARQKCPAFQNNACPFRAATDPDAMRDALEASETEVEVASAQCAWGLSGWMRMISRKIWFAPSVSPW